MNSKKMNRLRKQFRSAGIKTDQSAWRMFDEKTLDEILVYIPELVRQTENPAIQLGGMWLKLLELAHSSIEGSSFEKSFKILHILLPFSRFLFGIQELSPIINNELFELFKNLLKADISEQCFQQKSDCVSEFLQIVSSLPSSIDLNEYTLHLDEFTGKEFLSIQLYVATDFKRNKLLQRELARYARNRLAIWQEFASRDRLLERCIKLEPNSVPDWELKIISRLCEQL